MFHIVLVEPEIPQNAGNIARTCAATGTKLHMIRPLGFEVSDKYLKRAGLDYWDKLSVTYYESVSDFYEKNPDAEIYYFSSKGHKNYCDIAYPRPVFLMFGPETRGLPEDLLRKNIDRCVRIPMLPTLRCLNLSNAVAVAVYEVLRSGGFADMEISGGL